MIKRALLIYIIYLFVLSPLFLHADMDYQVQIEGVKDKETLAVLKTISQLIALQDSPPATLAALHRRVDADIPQLIQGLRTFGYYNSKVHIEIDSSQTPAQIVLYIDTGPIYPLAQLCVIADPSPDTCGTSNFDYASIDPKELGVTIGAPALPKNIIDAEEALLQLLLHQGYPLAVITKRDVVADQAAKNISVTLYAKSGPHAYFGETTITGCSTVEAGFIRNKISWHVGDLYNPKCIEETQAKIEESGLFSSIAITHAEEPDEEGLLAMDISILENYHRTLSFGASYTTQLGPGITSAWEHRNWWGLGQKLGIEANVWQRRQNARIFYLIPDFCYPEQSIAWLAEAEHETTRGFTESFISFSAVVNRPIDAATEISYGGALKDLRSENSDNNGNFFLIKIPLQIRWNIANDLLDPTQGCMMQLKLIPTAQLLKPQTNYVISTLISSAYFPLVNTPFVLATKLSLGTVIGASRISIPPPERFYAGSENTLRGYNYLTVSPLNKDNKPIGGRSLLIYTFEPRWRINEEFGLVVFYEIGNVYASPTPQLAQKQLQSLGGGIRYHTAVGPLRLDIAIPLNRRRHIDSSFQIYFSIGQAF